jgi:hypothetical protein
VCFLRRIFGIIKATRQCGSSITRSKMTTGASLPWNVCAVPAWTSASSPASRSKSSSRRAWSRYGVAIRIRADPSVVGSASSASIFSARCAQTTADRKLTRVGRPPATMDEAQALVEAVSTRMTGSSGPQSGRNQSPIPRSRTEPKRSSRRPR